MDRGEENLEGPRVWEEGLRWLAEQVAEDRRGGPETCEGTD